MCEVGGTPSARADWRRLLGVFAAFALGAPALGGLAVALPMWVAILVGRVSGGPDGDALYVLGFPLAFGLFGLGPAALKGLDAALRDREALDRFPEVLASWLCGR